MTRVSTWLRLLVALIALYAAPVAQALEEDKDCTWFPDIRCGRHGRYDGFVMPMSMPYLFEDPFITTGVQAVGIYHEYPSGKNNESAFMGGDAWVAALQVRVAITDRLAFIATKDGYAWSRPDNELLKNEQGFFDIAAGFKYALIDMPEKNFILTPAFRVDLPVGNRRVFSGNGDGVFIPSTSLGWGIGDFRMIAGFGGRFPIDANWESSSFFYNLHLAYNVLDFFVPFVEFNAMSWIKSGDGKLKFDVNGVSDNLAIDDIQNLLGIDAFEAYDIANIGTRNVQGQNFATFAFGARFPIGKHLSFGLSYEIPMTDREDITERRATAMILLEY